MGTNADVVPDERPPGVWDSFHITDGRVITGTNPASSMETAKAIVEAFEKL
jgi:putative intracellular protease/amidase